MVDCIGSSGMTIAVEAVETMVAVGTAGVRAVVAVCLGLALGAAGVFGIGLEVAAVVGTGFVWIWEVIWAFQLAGSVWIVVFGMGAVPVVVGLQWRTCLWRGGIFAFWSYQWR